MAGKNDRRRRAARSRKQSCKLGTQFMSQRTADEYLLRLEKSNPLRALGMRSYRCRRCHFWHVGRGRTNG